MLQEMLLTILKDLHKYWLLEVIKQKIIAQIQNSEFIVLMIDETTDVAIMKQLILYGRFIHDGAVQTRFLHM